MSEVQEEGAAAPLLASNTDEDISLVQVPQELATEDSGDAVMTDAATERRPEARERPISTTPVPLPQFPRASPAHNSASQVPAVPTPPTPIPATNGASVPAPNQTSASAARGSSPMPARTGTPRGVNGTAPPAEPVPAALPTEATPHGAPVRQYLNSKVTKELLAGMKLIAKEQPKDPLRRLGEFLLRRSEELETA